MKINAAVKEELEIVRASKGGRLTPASVLEYARNEDTALWKVIDDAGLWDDSRAALAGRLAFCRQLIQRVYVQILDNEHPVNIRAYVSLIDERRQGGYQLVTEVATTHEGQEKIVETALAELKAFRNKYARLKHLAPIIANIDEFLESDIDNRSSRNESEASRPEPGFDRLALAAKPGRG